MSENTNETTTATGTARPYPLYGKVIRRTSKVKAHDEASTAGVGDLVLIMETRPLSATKRWRLVEILEKAK
jgi:small subunit ribosomal protein S17